MRISRGISSDLGFFVLVAVHLVWMPCAAADPVVLTISGMVGSSSVNGSRVGAGTYSLSELAAAGSAVGTVTNNGDLGVPLWSLLGGDSVGNSAVVTSTPSGDNGKNAILRSYVLATSATGNQTVVSLGEIDPFFGATAPVPIYVSLSSADGKPQLVLPAANAAARGVADLASLQILSTPALPTGTGGTSSSFTLSGASTNGGIYSKSTLQSLSAATTTISGDTYTGVALWDLLGASGTNELTSYVVAGATDGYEVLYSLAELDPALGAPLDLVPYADTIGQFPSNGVARIIIPGDNHQGRWVSNLNSLQIVSAVPEPSSAMLTIFGMLGCTYLTNRCAKRGRKKQSGNQR